MKKIKKIRLDKYFISNYVDKLKKMNTNLNK